MALLVVVDFAAVVVVAQSHSAPSDPSRLSLDLRRTKIPPDDSISMIWMMFISLFDTGLAVYLC